MRDKININLSRDFLHSILEYNPSTGVFLWRKRLDRSPQWNGRYAGKVAGTFDKTIQKNKSTKYGRISINKDEYKYHRLAWLYMYGEIPKIIDHINGNGLDNRIDNLRASTDGQNQYNSKKPITNKSGYKGVSPYFKTGKWQATIRYDNRQIRLGVFNCPTAAHIAYCAAAKKYHGEFARFE